MGKHTTTSGIIVVIVIFMIAISTSVVVAYTTSILDATVAFASTGQMSKLADCGITVPNELIKIQSDGPSLLPLIYMGFPGLMIIIALLMFIAGYYFSSDKSIIEYFHIRSKNENCGDDKHESSASTTSETTTTVSNPNRNAGSGRFEVGRHVEQTRTETTTKKEENEE